jgi:mono/diheme cytochrome c family protein
VWTLLLILFLPVSSGTGAGGDLPSAAREILAQNCYACHGPDEEARKADLRLDRREDLLAGGKSGSILEPGEEGPSLLVRRITDPLDSMPPKDSGHALDSSEIALLIAWVEAGAPAARHWAFEGPQASSIPDTFASDWPRSDLDRFILARLEAEGLEPASSDDPFALLRRLSFDLRGLPPTWDEVEAFAASPSDAAYENLVDQYLADPAYGERWAVVWLDLARYADSMGHGSDPLRTIWPYRDWVIAAYNRNLPFDQFSLEQLAGDLLPEPTESQRLATAFHRNTMTNTEGGTDDEEFRVLAVKDRTNTTFAVWMGLSMGCAECHSHKFDPISQEDYYSAFAIFNQTADRDQSNDGPHLEVLGGTGLVRAGELKRRIEELQAEQAAARSEESLLVDFFGRQAALDQSWRPVLAVSAQGEEGTEGTLAEDGLLLLTGPNPEREHLALTFNSEPTRALRLDVVSDSRLPRGGPGRSPGNGNFVLSHLKARLVPESALLPQARFVRLDLPGENRILSLAEVEIISGGVNVAGRGVVTQSSVDYSGPPELAVDGNTSGVFSDGSVTHTRAEANPWWQVEWPTEQIIEEVIIHNRTGPALEVRLAGVLVSFLDDDGEVIWRTGLESVPTPALGFQPGRDPLLVPIQKASASFSQADWGVENAIDLRTDGGSGWGISPRQGSSQRALFDLGFLAPAGEWTLELWQDYGSQHTIGALRLATTAAMGPMLALESSLRKIYLAADQDLSLEDRSRLVAQARATDPGLLVFQEQIDVLRMELSALPRTKTPTMVALAPDKQRETHVLVRGNFLSPAKQVLAAMPAAFVRETSHPEPTRLDLARWLCSPDNPLTARVQVNRLWARLFGAGLVRTEEDFGHQGSAPSHPALLDWLALEFVASGWDQKAMLRTLVLSATYRQDALQDAHKTDLDPDNRLLSRGPRVRLEAEMVRDQALALSGLLTSKLGGRSVFPPQPPGLWQAAFNGQRDWKTDRDENRFRRGLYVFLRRTTPYPMLEIFDATSRESCTIRRIPTNTPLQALVTLNDPVFHEVAVALGRRIVQEGGLGFVERAAYALRMIRLRPPDPERVEIVQQLAAAEEQRFGEDLEQALSFAAPKDSPLGGLPEGADPAEYAAWTLVAGVLLNLDEVLVK